MSPEPRRRVGLIVNPVAGVGGTVGLKGSDGADIVRRALASGASREAPGRARVALSRLAHLRDHVAFVTCPGEMGAAEARACGLEPEVIALSGGAYWGAGRAALPDGSPATSADDTMAAARALRERGVDLLLFAGGDGTARDVCRAVGDTVVCLGVPAGVKIHSAVYATTPGSAGELAALFLHDRPAAVRLREAEVMDLDEAAFRDGRVSARLFGYLTVPYERSLVQCAKAGGCAGDEGDLRAIAADVVNGMEPRVLYVLGPGTTTRAVAQALGLDKTLLGVDAVRDGRLVGADLSERRLLELLGERAAPSAGTVGAAAAPSGGAPRAGTAAAPPSEEPAARARIVVTVIGGQGYIFGRGNQQVSAEVIRRVGRDNVVVVASETKLLSLSGKPLLVDSGDPALDAAFAGYRQVVTGLGRRTIYRVAGASGS